MFASTSPSAAASIPAPARRSPASRAVVTVEPAARPDARHLDQRGRARTDRRPSLHLRADLPAARADRTAHRVRAKASRQKLSRRRAATPRRRPAGCVRPSPRPPSESCCRTASAMRRWPSSDARGRCLRKRLDTGLPDQSGNLVHQLGEQRRVRGRGDASWNISSPTTPRSPESTSGSIVAMRRRWPPSPRRCDARRQSRQLDLESLARLDDVGHPVGMFAQRLDGALFGGTADEDGAVAMANRQDALHLECDKGLAQRSAADAEFGGQLALGGQPIARAPSRCRRCSHTAARR